MQMYSFALTQSTDRNPAEHETHHWTASSQTQIHACYCSREDTLLGVFPIVCVNVKPQIGLENHFRAVTTGQDG